MEIAFEGDLNLVHTFDCGQCFRWNKEQDGSYTGVVSNYAANLKISNNLLYIKTNFEDEAFWTEYLDLRRDYGKIKAVISKDEVIKKAISCGNGIRILKQPTWECIISFIISQNNNIPRIKKIISSLCENFGDEILFDGKKYFSFPTAKQLLGKDLSVIRAGFRDKYIADAVEKVLSGEICFDEINDMSTEQARKRLKLIKGVGDKVADCILLFGFGKYDLFPTDVWIKRILTILYNVAETDIQSFAAEKFENYGGFAQQYLFYFAQQNSVS